uniref:Uncharacterized protein n=1 Tax=Anguilla anguilla TaxID=7936 RepID=A0A0E9UVD1_ANGAN
MSGKSMEASVGRNGIGFLKGRFIERFISERITLNGASDPRMRNYFSLNPVALLESGLLFGGPSCGG